MLKSMYDKDIIEDQGTTEQVGWAMFAARWAVGTVLVLITIKAYAYSMSGSVGVLGSLVDSAGDAGISLMMLMAIRYSTKPADADHRYGHGKIEGLAALFQGAFLAGAAFFLILESLQSFATPEPISHHMLAVGVAGVSIVLSMILVTVQNYALKKTHSLALAADQSHYKSDIALNGGVILGLVLNYAGGPLWVDPMIGLIIAGVIGLSAYKIGLSASDMLMDKELPDDVRLEITRVVEAHTGVYGMHDLRTRRTGANVHISFDIEVDPDITLQAAHEISRELEARILEKFPGADIIIHKDPKGDIYDARHRVHGVHH